MTSLSDSAATHPRDRTGKGIAEIVKDFVPAAPDTVFDAKTDRAFAAYLAHEPEGVCRTYLHDDLPVIDVRVVPPGMFGSPSCIDVTTGDSNVHRIYVGEYTTSDGSNIARYSNCEPGKPGYSELYTLIRDGPDGRKLEIRRTLREDDGTAPGDASKEAEGDLRIPNRTVYLVGPRSSTPDTWGPRKYLFK
jgi:hypothetical protein